METPWIRFGRIPCIMVILLSVGLLNHVIIAPLVLQASGRDAWLTILLCAIPLPLWLLLVYPIVRSIGTRPLGDWLAERTGKTARAAIVGVVLILLLMISYITSTDTISWGSSTYLPETPKLVTSVVFVGTCVAGAVLGMHVIAYMSCILLPAVSLLGVFVGTANSPRKDYSQLFPVMERGWGPILDGAIYVGAGFAELFLFTAFAGYVDRPFKRRHLIATGLFIVVLCCGPVIGVLTEFGPDEAMGQRFPAFAQWRLVQIGKYIEHIDFFAIYQWLSGAFVRTAAALCLCFDLIGIRKRKFRAAAGALVGAIIVALTVYPFGDTAEYRFYGRYFAFSFYLVLGLFAYMFLIATFSGKSGRRGDADALDRS
ncbi:endospore germination permease [Cohnella xylanilytica]|uniref:Endospore germination permease n=1 Tax=Cohnella xylanilytica TaxID=557555 RepID=A0A841TYH3_9BACL|nr:endospore germination permease [Cohnella xylanilytica]MBB6693607.1 endospore germination permease [Cohnella xylanilytica]